MEENTLVQLETSNGKRNGMLENYIALSNETLTLHLQRNVIVSLSAHLLVKEDTNRCNGSCTYI
jgi:hypothetical protein